MAIGFPLTRLVDLLVVIYCKRGAKPVRKNEDRGSSIDDAPLPRGRDLPSSIFDPRSSADRSLVESKLSEWLEKCP